MMRYCWVLSCDHRILSDEPPDNYDRLVYCPACGLSYSIKAAYPYRDEDAG